jgi:hypothetical protein
MWGHQAAMSISWRDPISIATTDHALLQDTML